MNSESEARALSAFLFESAKTRALWALILRLIAFSGGIAIIFAPGGSYEIAWITGAVAVAAEVVSNAADTRKSEAESVLRHLDLFDALGRPVPSSIIADLRMAGPSLLPAESRPPVYFEGIHCSPGPERAVRLAEQSSWWSKHLAASMARGYITATVTLVILGITILAVAIKASGTPSVAITSARVAVAVIVLALSASVWRQARAYRLFKDAAGEIEERAAALRGSANEIDSLLLLTDYQRARSAAPAIATAVYNKKRARLSSEWKRREEGATSRGTE